MCPVSQEKGLLGRSVELRKQGDESYTCCDTPGLAPRQINALLATTLDLYGKVLQCPRTAMGMASGSQSTTESSAGLLET